MVSLKAEVKGMQRNQNKIEQVLASLSLFTE